MADEDATGSAQSSDGSQLRRGSALLPGSASPLNFSTAESLVSKHMGYASNGTGTVGIIQSIGVVADLFSNVEIGPSNDAIVRYRTLIRQLPPQRHIKNLVAFFYKELSWQYEIVEENVFREHLNIWEQVPYAARNQPFQMAPDTRHFPALLFQLLAQALLFQPVQYDNSLEDLLHAPDMSLSDLASEFSDAGREISTIFGSSEISVTTVQAGLLRVCFEKTTGLVAEAWHTLGRTIRDAQELGLHRFMEVESTLSGQTPVALGSRVGRNLWLVLHLWDSHMAVVLDRPMCTELDSKLVPFADSGPNEIGTVSETMAATPFNMILCGYHAAYRYLQDIHRLSRMTEHKDNTVDAIHVEITANLSRVPVWAKLNSQTQDCDNPWLPAARETLHTEVHFTILALHRPFIFQRSQSRAHAFIAAAEILESQKRLFEFTEPKQYPAFNLVFATFDAAVLVAAIHILFPNENREQLPFSLKRLNWASERFYAMKSRNRLAGTAFSVVKAMYGKIRNGGAGAPGALQLDGSTEVASTQQLLYDLNAEATPEYMKQIPAVVFQSLDEVLPPQPLRDLVFQADATGQAQTAIPTPFAENLEELPNMDAEFWQIINGLGN